MSLLEPLLQRPVWLYSALSELGERVSEQQMVSLSTSTVTFLFTDMESPTALHEGYPDQMYAAFERHDENER